MTPLEDSNFINELDEEFASSQSDKIGRFHGSGGSCSGQED